MHEKIWNQLNAYQDGELHGKALQELKSHLASCDDCQRELRELHQVSDFLQSVPFPEFIRPERFTENINLKLPRREQTLMRKPFTWLLVPTGLVVFWFFFQAASILSNIVTVGGLTGILGNTGNWLSGWHQTNWFVIISMLFNGKISGFQGTLTTLNALDILFVSFLKGFLWQTLIGILYGASIFYWLRYHLFHYGEKEIALF